MKTAAESEAPLFPRGSRAPEAYFTGPAWVHPLLTPDEAPFDCSISNVVFEPGARNNWHTHPAGQVLVCTAGAGYYQEKGQPVQRLLPGTVVKIRPGVEHWHGATPDSSFTHLAINPNTEQGVVTWLASVTDEEYQATQA